jgi:hypothetical protein
MLEPHTIALMDKLVRPLLASEGRELNGKITKAAEWAVSAGVPGSGLAFHKRSAVYFDHHKELAASVWGAMLRVLDETGLDTSPNLSGDLKRKFDEYLGGPAKRARSSMVALGQMGHAMPRETFDAEFELTRAKYHTEIDLRCHRVAGEPASAQMLIGELNTGDTYTAGQVGAMGPQAEAHDTSFQEINAQRFNQIDTQMLAVELATLRQEMRRAATGPEEDVAIGQIAAAEVAAKQGDAAGAVRLLKSAGKWALEIASKIGVNVASEVIKKSVGL